MGIRHTFFGRVGVCRVEKDKQQLMVEIDSISTALDSSNKAKVRLFTVCDAASRGYSPGYSPCVASPARKPTREA